MRDRDRNDLHSRAHDDSAGAFINDHFVRDVGRQGQVLDHRDETHDIVLVLVRDQHADAGRVASLDVAN